MEILAYLAGLALLLQPAISSPIATPDEDMSPDPFDPDSDTNSRVNCPSGVQIIAARGTSEAPGMGSMQSLAGDIMDKIPNSKAIGLRYPAKRSPSYSESEEKGVAHMANYVRYYNKNCPNTKLVLLGYSQGGHVAMDTLCGASEDGFTQSDAMGTDLSNNIVAVVVYGDPSHVTGTPWDRGNAKKDGIFPREKGCAGDGGKIVSYCDAGDPYCASGKYKKVHGQYFYKYNDEASQFVAKKFRNS